MTATEKALDLARVAAQAAADKLATDITIIDVSDRLALTDCFVVATGSTERQIGAIVDAVEEKMREAGYKPVAREGERDGHWVLLDFVEIVVHIQHAEQRVFYALDRLWKDCPSFPFVDGEPGTLRLPDRTSEGRVADGDDDDAPADGAAGDDGADDDGADDEDLRL